jgi:hypothetical protein
MIGTSCTRADRIWKFSNVFTSMLIVHDTPKGATAVVAGIDDPGPRAFVISRTQRKKSRLSLRFLARMARCSKVKILEKTN